MLEVFGAVAWWFISEVGAPGVMEAAVERMKTDRPRRAAKEVKRWAKVKPGEGYRRWYAMESTWTDLVSRRNQEGYDRLVDSLARYRSGEHPTDKQIEEARKLVAATMFTFMNRQTPQMATEIVGARLGGAIDQVATDVTEIRVALLGVPSTELAWWRERFPPAAQEAAEAVDPRDPELRRLLGMLDPAQPAASVDAILAVPGWLTTASGPVQVLAAQLGQSYANHAGAAPLFELAAEQSVERARLYGRAAVHYKLGGNVDAARRTADKALAIEVSPATTVLYPVIDDDFDGLLAALSAEDALLDPMFSAWYAQALLLRSGTNEAIGFFERAVEKFPTFTGLKVNLARFLGERSQDAGSTSRATDLTRARKLALEARDLRRKWRGASAEAAELACRLAVTASDFAQIITLGSLPPRGEATPEEAADSSIRLMLARALRVIGDHAEADAIAASIPDGDFTKALLHVDLLRMRNAPPAEIGSAVAAAWDLAVADDQKVSVWLSAAHAGVPPPGEDELASRDDDIPMVVHVQQLLAAADVAEAVRFLRAHELTERIVDMLDTAYVRAGQIDDAVALLLDAADRFSNPSHLANAVGRLAGAERWEDAAKLAVEVIGRVPPAFVDDRMLLHEVLIKDAHDRGAWHDMVNRVRAVVDERGPSLKVRWLLVQATANLGNTERAWELMTEAPALTPETGLQAELWISLNAEHRDDAEFFTEILALVDRSPDDRSLGTRAAATFFTFGDRPDLDEAVIARFQALLQEMSVDATVDPTAPLVRIEIGSDPESMVDALRPFLEPRHEAVTAILRQVLTGHPTGMLSMGTGRPYTSVWTRRGVGVLPLYSPDPLRQSDELTHARAAIGSPVVVDLSTLTVGAYLPALWPTLRSAFPQLRVVAEARRDVTTAAAELDVPSSGTLGWDPRSGIPKLTDIDTEVLAREVELTQRVRDAAEAATAVEWTSFRSLNDDANISSATMVWLGALDLAKSAGVPLWCDDVGMRTLAHSEHVPTFGTIDLMLALVERGDLDDLSVHKAVRQLREEFAVDLPLDAEWMILSATAGEFQPGPAAMTFTRPATWRDPATAIAAWNEISQRAAVDHRDTLPDWVYVGVLGIVRTIAAPQAAMVAPGFAVKAILAVEVDPVLSAQILAAARAAAAEENVASPVPRALAMLLSEIGDAFGSDQAAALLASLSEHLEEPDRADLQQLLFRASGSEDDSGGF